MAESRFSTLRALVTPKLVRIALGLVGALGGYDAASSQFDWPKLPKLWGMSGGLLPWWGWLLVLQAIFVYALFEYVRMQRLTSGLDPQVAHAMGNVIANYQDRISGLEQSFSEIKNHKINTIEAMLRPKAGLLHTVLNDAEFSRLDQISEEMGGQIEAIDGRLGTLREEVKQDIDQLARSLRARDSLADLDTLDKEIRKNGERLMRASTEDFSDEGAWLAAYELWTRDARKVDAIFWQWFPKAPSILAQSQEALRESPQPPSNGVFVRSPSISGYMHVNAALRFYLSAYDFLAGKLEEIAKQLPSE